ncbi:MAG: 16S rRNA (guanine(527)-N(7))-methyltransferase RsmG [Pseudomonadales bacterium]|nr:16S rRNA (guanine(527)-N(7))-methyltransferase RsmG [Pseudomonadales bacterium]
MKDDARSYLHQGLQGRADSQALARLEAYVDALLKWNRAYNLTALKEEKQVVVRHILDSASILPALQSPLLDVGTGPGLPGLVLSILKPDADITLLDSNGKKVRFLRQMISELELPKVEVILGRVEDQRGHHYQAISSRAFASLLDMREACHHLLVHGGCYLAMKGRYPEEELQQLPEEVEVVACQVLEVPYLQEARHLVILRERHPAEE